MGTTLLQILPLAAAAAVSPTGLLFVMMILSSGEGAERRATRFVAGASVFLVALALLVTLAWTPVIKSAGQPHLTSGLADIFLGVVVILLLAKAVFFKRESRQRRLGRLPYFILGVIFMLTNFSTLVPFIAASRIIADAQMDLWKDFLLLPVLLVITLSLIVFPVAVTGLAPRKSQRILAPVNGFMSRYGTHIAQVLFLLIAIYLVARGALKIMT